MLDALFRGLGVCHHYVSTDMSPPHSGPQILHLSVRELVGTSSQVCNLKAKDFNLWVLGNVLHQGVSNFLESCLASESHVDSRPEGASKSLHLSAKNEGARREAEKCQRQRDCSGPATRGEPAVS